MAGNFFRRFLNRLFRDVESHEIAPDEIFLDSSNLPEFDTTQFEGRLEHPITKTTVFLVSFVFIVILLVFIGRLYSLQVAQGKEYSGISENNRLEQLLIFAERGVVYDRNGEELIWNEEQDGEAYAGRRYSDTLGLAHVLGHVDYPVRDSAGFYWRETFEGKDGIEQSLSERLSGRNGLKLVEVDAFGSVKSESVIHLPKDGENLTLSIDSRVQEALYRLIRERAQDAGFVGGAGVIMDVRNGEVLALVSYPEYDSQVLTDGDDRDTIASYVEDYRKPFLNRAVAGLYTPGSTIKPFVALGALENGVITPEKSILSTGSIEVPNPYVPGEVSVFKDWKAHGWVDMRKAIAVSSNVYFYEVGGGFEDQRGIGIDGIEKFMRLFGFGSQTGIDLPIEEDGIIPNREWKAENFDGDIWRLGDTYNTAIGQYGFQVTPLQAARGIAAIANGGELLTPSLVMGEKLDSENLDIDPSYLEVIREGMRMGVTGGGTAQALNVAGVSTAAKTGTAQVGARNEFMNSWVTGFFPYEEPKYAFAIIMERAPAGTLTGAPLVGQGLLSWLLSYATEYVR